MHGIALNSPCAECLEACAYRNEDGNLVIPSAALHGALINASGGYKIGNKRAPPMIAGAVHVEPFEVPLLGMDGKPLKKFETHTTPVVIQRQRVIRFRPWIKEWKADFSFVYDYRLLTDTDKLHDILIDAGRQVGILDFRPQHRGRFGTFSVERWESA